MKGAAVMQAHFVYRERAAQSCARSILLQKWNLRSCLLFFFVCFCHEPARKKRLGYFRRSRFLFLFQALKKLCILTSVEYPSYLHIFS